MLIVSDSSPLTNLIQIGLLDVLEILFERIIIPVQVYKELSIYENQKNVLDERPWIVVKQVSNKKEVNKLNKRLDPGEAEAIILSMELGATSLLIDEKKGRRIAKQYGLKIVGLLGILVLAKRKGHIEELKPVLEKLRTEANFYIHPLLYEKILLEDEK